MENREINLCVYDPAGKFGPLLGQSLRESGFKVAAASSENGLIAIVHRDLPNIVLKSYASATNMKSKGLMERVHAICPDIQFIFVSPVANVQLAMEAVRRGAADCLPLPCEPAMLLESVRRTLQHQKLAAENPEILRRLHADHNPNILAGRSASMMEIQGIIDRVAESDVTVLIQGESGTGKELAARLLHEKSDRADGPFVAVNCAALPDSLIESELFGHVKGSFTGATHDKPGRFELARGGTLFLDEIGELSPLGQADLLRILEDGIYRPIGSRTTVRADVRILAATNRDLEKACGEGSFREDLFYRLNVINLHLPSIRERPEDIPDLAEVFIRHFCAKHRRPMKTIGAEAKRSLAAFSWPGNVRQLRNVIERMVLLEPARILGLEHLPPYIPGGGASKSSTNHPLDRLRPGMTIAEAEKRLIAITLANCGGNKSKAAKMLGVSRRKLVYSTPRI